MTQQEALAILESGQSVLLTGAAGTGKTYLMNEFIRRAKKRRKNIAVTATTGLAATHLNGATIHAWAGIGVHDELPRTFFQKMGKQRQTLIAKADILIIDEISMLHDYRLDMIEEVARKARGIDKPFGGLQVVLVGDFFQLPPVNRGDSRQGSFVLSSDAWQNGSFTVCYLQQQYRQSDDDAYAQILNGIRAGVLTRSQLTSLQNRIDVVLDPFVARTRLLTTNADVDRINDTELARLDAEEYEYEMETTGSKKYIEQLTRSCLAPELLRLKKGAHVMCIKNSPDKKYANGSLGIVKGFDKDEYPIIALNTGKTITMMPDTWELIDGDKRRATLKQLPLRLAWAITVHKSQGMTLDGAHIDLRRAFVEGMGYVALSRVKSMQQLALDGLNGMALKTSPLAREIDATLRARSTAALDEFAAVISKWRQDEEKRKANPQPDEPDKPAAGTWSEKLAKMREEYPNAYRPWAEPDDEKLKKMFGSKKTLNMLSKEFGRHPGSIKKRLEKHFGEDVIVN